MLRARLIAADRGGAVHNGDKCARVRIGRTAYLGAVSRLKGRDDMTQGTGNLEALRDMLSEAVQVIKEGMATRTLTRYDRERTDYVTDMLYDLISATDEAIEEVEFYGDRV